MKRWKRLISLAFSLALLGASAAAAQTSDPVAVQVGEVQYHQSAVQQYWDELTQLALASGTEIGENEYEAYRQSVIQSFVYMGVLENKYSEFGLDRLTDAEQKALQADTELSYQNAKERYAQQIAANYGKTAEEAAAYAETFMELDGVTKDAAYKQAFSKLKEKRMLQRLAGDLPPLTDEELTEYYQTNFVEPSRASYENDIAAFEKDVLVYGGETWFIPEGYRYVRHIYFPLDGETAAAVAALETELEAARQAYADAEQLLYARQLLGDDDATAKLELETADGEIKRLEKERSDAEQKPLAKYADEIADIQKRLAAGESFTALVKEYSRDTVMPEEGFMVCQASVLWEARFTQGAMALTEIGQVSAPIVASSGVHILEYTSDAPSGAIALEGDVREQVAQRALGEKQYAVLTSFVEQWQSEYEIESHPELLHVPSVLTED